LGYGAGIDLHNELALLVEAGFTPLEAMQAATLNPAKFLGKTETFGTIQAGRTADLVLLDENPLEDISHTRKINARRARWEVLPAGNDESASPARCREEMMNTRMCTGCGECDMVFKMKTSTVAISRGC